MELFEHFRCPLHRYTFSVKPVRSWVEQHCEGRVLDLFAGPTPLNIDETRNDLDPEMPTNYHCDALEFLRTWRGEKFNTILLDPPMLTAKAWSCIKGGLQPIPAVKGRNSSLPGPKRYRHHFRLSLGRHRNRPKLYP